MTTNPKAIYQQSLRNTHAAEQQGLTEMRSQVKGLVDYANYRALLERHIATTERQIGRIETAMREADAEGGALREAVTTAAGAVGAAVHAVMPDQTLKNLYAGYAYQHEQIAAYASLAVIAKAAGFDRHTGWIEETLSEERKAARDVEAIIPRVTERFIQVSAS